MGPWPAGDLCKPKASPPSLRLDIQVNLLQIGPSAPGAAAVAASAKPQRPASVKLGVKPRRRRNPVRRSAALTPIAACSLLSGAPTLLSYCPAASLHSRATAARALLTRRRWPTAPIACAVPTRCTGSKAWHMSLAAQPTEGMCGQCEVRDETPVPGKGRATGHGPSSQPAGQPACNTCTPPSQSDLWLSAPCAACGRTRRS